ncbi:hypothetical protein C1646_751663 [Rhizophagus diaphanus]|nr:hypothetical protein C1646_751663 [Rhizophagus diaphanus] [Rhizophagus sp. MUCL 43196]
MASKFHDGLSQDFSLMLSDADDYNVNIQVGENENIKEFHTHSNIHNHYHLKDFPSLDKDILNRFLERDDLQIEEIVAWDYLIKWGINQTHDLGINNNNKINWNNNNYESLRKL